MKPFKRIYAVDSPECILLNEDVKVVRIEVVFLKLIGWICLFALALFGLIGGVTSKFAQEKLQSLDAWSNDPANKELLFYVSIFFISVILIWFVLYWVYKILSK